MKRSRTIFSVLMFSMTLISTSAMGAAFIKFDGVDGESKDENHAGWSDVLTVTHGYLFKLIPDEKEKYLPLESVEVEDVVVTLELDKAGLKIADALLKGKVFPTVQIEFTAEFGDARATYYRYTFANVSVNSYRFNGSGIDTDGPPTQSVGLSFTEVTTTYTEYDEDGNSLGNVEYSYEVPM